MENVTLTEGIIVAILALATAWGGAWLSARSSTRQVQQKRDADAAIAQAERAKIEASEQAELRRDLMARIDQLQAHIIKLEDRITAKDARIMTLETRVDELEAENGRKDVEITTLRAELARICAEKGKAEK